MTFIFINLYNKKKTEIDQLVQLVFINNSSILAQQLANVTNAKRTEPLTI
jgi:hypothetical protein